MSKGGNVMGNYKELSYTESKKQILEFAKESRKRKSVPKWLKYTNNDVLYMHTSQSARDGLLRDGFGIEFLGLNSYPNTIVSGISRVRGL